MIVRLRGRVGGKRREGGGRYVEGMAVGGREGEATMP